MKTVNTHLIILLFIFVIACCSNNLSFGLRKKLKGRWIEFYHCKNVDCNIAIDSLQSAVLDFNEKKFSSELYRDSEQSIYDTSFSGKYNISEDSLEFILDNFTEVFTWYLSNDTLSLIAMYSIDSNGNKLGDFRSILWCCQIKKSGIFIKR